MVDTAGGKVTPIESGLIARLSGAWKALSGQGFFPPGQPLNPMAQDPSQGAVGRRFDYPFAINANTRIKDEGVDYATLRALAYNYGTLRLVIETRKDQMARLQWGIRYKDESKQPDARCDAIREFMRSPDRENSWPEWLRMVLEDMFVIDAACVYPRLTKGGQLYALEPVDGSTIKRVLDERGRTPLPGLPAYQQVLKGMPAVDYTADELYYVMRNPRTHTVYGFSPVEQIIMTVNIALRREVEQLSYYTVGNIPHTLLGAPADWTIEQIERMQRSLDAAMTGQSKHSAKVVPGGITPIVTRPEGLKDDMEEWLVRIVCYAFSIPPTAFTKSNNRATASTSKEQALQEGLEPIKDWTLAFVNRIIARFFGPDVEMHWIEEQEIAPLDQATVLSTYVLAKVMTPDEAREKIGLPPLTPAQKEELAPEPPPAALPAPKDDGEGGTVKLDKRGKAVANPYLRPAPHARTPLNGT